MARFVYNLKPGEGSMKHVIHFLVCIFMALPLLPQKSHALSEQQELLDEARITFDKLIASPEFAELPRYVKNARALMIFPDVFKGGFGLGGEGGSGILVVRNLQDKNWSQPAFYTLFSGSLGLQVGVQISEVIFTIMNDNALNAILDNQVKFGAGISVAVGPIGKGLGSNTTTNFDADVYSFAKTSGLFGGISFEGSGIVKKDSYNHAYYDSKATPYAIVIENRYNNPNTRILLNALAPY